MKTIPKYVEKLLDRRYKLAMDLMDVTAEVDVCLEKFGVLDDPEIADAVTTGCLIYCEPEVARKVVKECLEKRLRGE